MQTKCNWLSSVTGFKWIWNMQTTISGPVYALFVTLGLGPFASPRRCWYFWGISTFLFLKVASSSQMLPVLSACLRMASWSSFLCCFQLATCANLLIWGSLSQTLPCMQKLLQRSFLLSLGNSPWSPPGFTWNRPKLVLGRRSFLGLIKPLVSMSWLVWWFVDSSPTLAWGRFAETGGAGKTFAMTGMARLVVDSLSMLYCIFLKKVEASLTAELMSLRKI